MRELIYLSQGMHLIGMKGLRKGLLNHHLNSSPFQTLILIQYTFQNAEYGIRKDLLSAKFC